MYTSHPWSHSHVQPCSHADAVLNDRTYGTPAAAEGDKNTALMQLRAALVKAEAADLSGILSTPSWDALDRAVLRCAVPHCNVSVGKCGARLSSVAERQELVYMRSRYLSLKRGSSWELVMA
jgi:hypothetical protein